MVRRKSVEPPSRIPEHLRPMSSLWEQDIQAWRDARSVFARGGRQHLLNVGTNPVEWLLETRRYDSRRARGRRGEE